jgi:hypothetical protein
MASESWVECSFFIPVHRDRNLSDGGLHPAELWIRLDEELFFLFSGRTLAPDLYRGFYRDPDTGERVDDESRRYLVALPESELPGLRDLLSRACEWFRQKCIYLSVAGRVEFIRGDEG